MKTKLLKLIHKHYKAIYMSDTDTWVLVHVKSGHFTENKSLRTMVHAASLRFCSIGQWARMETGLSLRRRAMKEVQKRVALHGISAETPRIPYNDPFLDTARPWGVCANCGHVSKGKNE